MCFSFTACGEKNELIGTWREELTYYDADGEEYTLFHTIVFNEDGTGSGIGQLWLDEQPDDADEFTYNVDGECVHIKSIYYDFHITATYCFEGETLLLTVPYNPSKPYTYELSYVKE